MSRVNLPGFLFFCTMPATSPHRRFASLLLDWYDPADRPMPWKGERDPYRIWISEVILHQTRVQQGWEPYLRFIGHFPDVATLAAAPADAVLAAWQGLGYYRRALHLHAGAKYIMDEREGKLPGTADEWLQVKGIGPYSAAAIASFAFNEPRAVLDGNVFRVLARVFCLAADPRQERPVFAELAGQLLPRQKSAVYNQAIMDLGATICTPARPRCQQCPLSTICCSYREGRQIEFPIRPKPVTVKRLDLYLLILKDKGKLLLRQRPDTGIYRRMWDLPGLESTSTLSPAEVQQQMRAVLPGMEKISLLATDSQQLTHRKLFIHYFEGVKPEGFKPPAGYRFYSANQFKQIAVPAYLSRLIERLYPAGTE